jgi:hypothetical protein
MESDVDQKIGGSWSYGKCSKKFAEVIDSVCD